jgi:hypothetical protein
MLNRAGSRVTCFYRPSGRSLAKSLLSASAIQALICDNVG